MNPALSRFLLTSAALLAAHEVADHWIQTDHQACTKGAPGWPGRRACAGHVAAYTATGALAVYAASRRLNVPLRPAELAAGLVRREGYVTAVTVLRHPGAQPQETGPGTGLFHLDQSWHYGWIFVSALVAAGRSAA
jgi:hypothetical protein